MQLCEPGRVAGGVAGGVAGVLDNIADAQQRHVTSQPTLHTNTVPYSATYRDEAVTVCDQGRLTAWRSAVAGGVGAAAPEKKALVITLEVQIVTMSVNSEVSAQGREVEGEHAGEPQGGGCEGGVL